MKTKDNLLRSNTQIQPIATLRLIFSLCQIAYHYYFEYYTIYAIIILKNGVKCEVRKWKLN